MKLEDRLKRLEDKAGRTGVCRCGSHPVEVIYPGDEPRVVTPEKVCEKCGGVYTVDVVRIVWETEAQ